MAKFISLVNYTAKGIENIKESPNRLDAFKQLCESMGVTVDGFFLTMGRYDLVVIVDAPDLKTAAKVVLTTGSAGAVSTETLPAFTEAEFRQVVSELP
ncbi:MAG: GYD domain-containing protein [Deltaproteobacteria bacterium]|nr:GYD domain-containing protein [Deltaproteobacteria bacterium]